MTLRGKKGEGPIEQDGGQTSGPTADPILEAIEALRSEMISHKSEICSTISTQMAQISSELRGEISALQQETQTAMSSLQVTTDSHSSKLRDLEHAATHNSDLTTTLQSEIKRLSTDVKWLAEKCDSLEGYSRRCNLRIIGVAEKEEGPKPRDFAARLLKDVLELDEEPLLDRAHRSLQKQPQPGEPPRALILKLHYFHVREEILHRARDKNHITYNGRRLHIFPDYSPSVSKRRAAFNEVRRLLRDRPGVRYGMVYPARLRVSHNGVEKYFTTAEEATSYVRQHIVKD